MLLGEVHYSQNCRDMGLALCLRARRSIAAGQVEEAWQDLLACHRLARLIPQGGLSIDLLVGIVMEGVAIEADLALLDSGKLSVQQIKNCLSDVQQLPPMPKMADTIEFMERFMFIDTVMAIEHYGIGALERLSGGNPGPELFRPLENVDPNAAIRVGHHWYDRQVAAMRLNDPGSRKEALARIQNDLKSLKKDLVKGDIRDLLDAGASAEIRGKRLGETLIGLLFPAGTAFINSADRQEQSRRNLTLALALAWYHKEQGRYPEKLAALSPTYLSDIPLDLFSGKELIYRAGQNDYLLYSVGVNGVDDQGRTVNDAPPGDDLVIRMPLPAPRQK